MAVNMAGIAGLGWLAVVSAGPMAVVCSLAAIGLTAATIYMATSTDQKKSKTQEENNLDAVI